MPMPPRVFRTADADPHALQGRRVAVLGYGNQGRAQALNLRDSGVEVLVCNRPDDWHARAVADGFTPAPLAAAADADVVMFLLPDEVLPEVFASLAATLRPAATLCFASGYAVAFGQIVPPPTADVVLLAPRMVGHGVRERFERGQGFFSLVAVEQDATGQAWRTMLGLANGIGTLRQGAVECTFRMEAELDLFNEQAFGPAFGRVLLAAVQTLVEAGYPKEIALLEVYLSGELSHICQRFADAGLIGQLDEHSHTSQYGAISRGIRFLGADLAGPMRRVLRDIRSGAFAREWAWERRTGGLRFRFLKFMALRQPIRRWEDAARKFLGLSR